MIYFSKKHLILSFLTVSIIIASCKSKKKLTGNPYLDAKISVSQQQAMEEKKILAQQNKAYAKQLEKNKKDIAENNSTFYEKKQHRWLTKRKINRRRNRKAQF